MRGRLLVACLPERQECITISVEYYYSETGHLQGWGLLRPSSTIAFNDSVFFGVERRAAPCVIRTVCLCTQQAFRHSLPAPRNGHSLATRFLRSCGRRVAGSMGRNNAPFVVDGVAQHEYTGPSPLRSGCQLVSHPHGGVCVHCPAGHRCDGLRDALPSRYPFSRRHDVACCEPRDPGLAWIHGGYVQCSAAVLCVTRLDAGPSFNVARTVALASSKAPDVYRRVISQEACRTVQLRTLHHAALIPFPSLAPVCIADVAAASCTISVCAPVARVPCRPLSSSADERWCRRWCCRKRDKSWEMTMTALRRLSFRSQHLR